MLKFLINDAKVDANAKTKAGESALHFAAKRCTLEIVKFLVEATNAGDNFENVFYVS